MAWWAEQTLMSRRAVSVTSSAVSNTIRKSYTCETNNTWAKVSRKSYTWESNNTWVKVSLQCSGHPGGSDPAKFAHTSPVVMHHVHHIFFLNIFAIIPARKDFVFNLFAITPAHGKIPSHHGPCSRNNLFFSFFVRIHALGKIPPRLDPLRRHICFWMFFP